MRSPRSGASSSVADPRRRAAAARRALLSPPSGRSRSEVLFLPSSAAPLP